MIGYTKTLTTSGHRSNNFGPSYPIKNDTEYPQTVISALRIRQKTICKLCGGIGHKADDFIILGPELLPTSLRKIWFSSTPFMINKQMNH